MHVCTTELITLIVVCVFVCHTGPPDPPDQLALLSLSAYQAQVSWVQPFDGNDPVVVFHILVWNNDVNVSCVSVSIVMSVSCL